MSNTNWSDTQIPANSSFTDETPLANSAFSEVDITNTAWARNSGIDTSIPTYDDSTLTYDEITEYYDGFNSNIITEDDVHFSAITDETPPANSSWTDIT